MKGVKRAMIEKLYQKYMSECSNTPVLDNVSLDTFQEKISKKLSVMNRICMDDGAGEQGVIYYSLRNKDGLQICSVPVYGYYASSEKTLSKLFCRLSDEVINNGSAEFQINLYAHDHEALKLFSMMQFGYIYEQGRLKITDEPYRFSGAYTIRTLTKDEIAKRWDEIWALTNAIVQHLRQAPVFYPGDEFTQEVYRAFFMDSETNLHIAFTQENKMIGIIESNSEPDFLAYQNTKSVNVGEIYVLPQYRGSALSKDLLHYAMNYEKQKGAEYLWVGHGTANPNARGFWNKYFKTYQYELVRKIEKR